jgi:hypothetical protein
VEIMNSRPVQHTLAASLPNNLIAPSGNPLQGGERRYVQTVHLFRNGAGAGDYSQVTAEFEVWIPSARLLTILHIGFLPDTQEDAVIPVGWDATLDVWAKTDTHGPFAGRRFRGNSIIPGPSATIPTALPWSWEAVTGVDQWRGTVTLPSDGTGLAVNGWLVASVSWEPAPGDDIPNEQLRKIFTACKLTPGSGAGSSVFESLIG